MAELMDYLRQAVEDDASDLFIVAGEYICEKLDKRFKFISEERIRPSGTADLIHSLYEMVGRSMEQKYLRDGDDDFSLSVPELKARFRVNTYRQRGSMAAVLRVVPFGIPDWRKLGIPEQVVMDLAKLPSKLVLVTGTAGSGKSTTQACILDQINQTRECHIITLEDPIEYLHQHNKSIVSQREISIDTENYNSALRACLRQAPDVILLGEMRDQETIRTAMTAAETGHLLIATLHTQGAVNTIDRIVDTFPSEQQDQIRMQLSTVLHTVVSQQLLRGKDGKLVPAFEIMHMNTAIRRKIRDKKTFQIDSDIEAGGAEGMISMKQSIEKLLKAGLVDEDTARSALAAETQGKGRMI